MCRRCARLTLVGYEPFYRQLKALGFDTLTRDADHYGYALALGGAEVTLLELANAYRALANGGGSHRCRWRTTSAGSRSRASVQVIDPRAAFIVNDILADAAARALTFGFASPLATRYRASVKTGTSKDMRDNWAVGFTRRYTVGVWVGNFSGAPMHDVSGVTARRRSGAKSWTSCTKVACPRGRRSGGLVRQHVGYAARIEPAREEWFLTGTETSQILPSTAPGRPRSTRPRWRGLAIDPDIPPARQRVAVTASGARAGARLRIGAANLPADAPQLWKPVPGRHVLRLVDEKGAELDRVQVTVRGVLRCEKMAAHAKIANDFHHQNRNPQVRCRGSACSTLPR